MKVKGPHQTKAVDGLGRPPTPDIFLLGPRRLRERAASMDRPRHHVEASADGKTGGRGNGSKRRVGEECRGPVVVTSAYPRPMRDSRSWRQTYPCLSFASAAALPPVGLTPSFGAVRSTWPQLTSVSRAVRLIFSRIAGEAFVGEGRIGRPACHNGTSHNRIPLAISDAVCTVRDVGDTEVARRSLAAAAAAALGPTAEARRALPCFSRRCFLFPSRHCPR